MPTRDKLTSLTDLGAIKNSQLERFAMIDAGLIDFPIFLKPCKVKILMLVDNLISYNHAYFGLSTVLDTLRLNPEWWVKFEITRAHRQTDLYKPAAADPAFALYGPHHENFSFTQAGFNINDYDEVWFYGFNPGTSTTGTSPVSLTNDELDVLFRWMDERDGGVLAMGDHYNLGEALCYRIPRVRNMRKWQATGGLNDPPQPLGDNRHDTNRRGHDDPGTGADESAQYSFDDESDDIPMNTRLRWYYHHHCGQAHRHPYQHWHWPYFWARSPHPVLCGTDGPINILPDHPHEGEVIVPSVLTDTLKFLTTGYSAREYPDYSGSPLSPEIIAWARVQNDHTNTNDVSKGQANGKEFGAIGAYNGHCVGVGRVIVDSTWHHWFDVNLTGRTSLSGSSDPRKHNGFNDTASGQAALARIKNYYRNVAIWLAPPAKLRCMSARGLWGSLFRFPLMADIHLKMPIWVIGHHAINVLGNYAGQCNVRWWWPLLVEKFPLQELLDPERMRVPVDSLKMLDEFMIGGVLHTLLTAKTEKFKDGKAPSDKELLNLSERGIQVGTQALLEHINEAGKTSDHVAAVMKSALDNMR